jgi:hypothetical protein
MYRVIALFIFALLLSPNARSNVIYSNIGPTDQFSFGSWIVANLNSPELFNHRVTGSRFTAAPGPNLELGSILAPIFLTCYVPAYPGPCATPPAGSQMDIWLNVFADSGGVPGPMLTRSSTQTITPQTPLSEFQFASGTVLTPGSDYWVQADTSVSIMVGGWAANQQGVLGLGSWLENFNGTLDFEYVAELDAPAFMVLSSVPEPKTWLMLLVAGPVLLTVATLRSSRRRQSEPRAA